MEEGREEIEDINLEFQEGWPFVRKAVKKLIKQIEEGVQIHENPTFTIHDYMSLYTFIYELRCIKDFNNAVLVVYDHYKKLFAKYLNFKVLPSMQAKRDEELLRELLKRWSDHKIITVCLSRLFRWLDYTHKMEHSLEEIGFLYFYDLIYEEVNKQVMDAILAMINEDRAGKQIDRKLINNILTVYLEIGDKTGKNDAKNFAEKIIKENATLCYDDDEASNLIATLSLRNDTPKVILKDKKMIKLKSYDGDVFEVEYEVALLSKTIQDVIETYPSIDDDDDYCIHLSFVSTKVLDMIIQYCKKHTEEINMSDSNLMKDWDAEFMKDLDQKTLFDILLSANYLNLNNLCTLICDTTGNRIKGKTLEEMSEYFGVAYVSE